MYDAGKRWRHRRPGGATALLRYAGAWLFVAVLASAALGAVVDGLGSEDEVALPPVRATQLEDAARQAGCRVRRARAGERLDPPVDGSRMEGVRPGVYERPLDAAIVGAAARQGIVLIHHARALDESQRDELRRLQEALPRGTIVTVNETMGEFELAATAYRRLIGCRRYTRAAVDAIRLFRGRYIGRGPDR